MKIIHGNPKDLRELTGIIRESTKGAAIPDIIIVPYKTWNKLRIQAGSWVRVDIDGVHFLWCGIPVSPGEA